MTASEPCPSVTDYPTEYGVPATTRACCAFNKPMPRTPFLIVDQSGQQAGILKAVRESWEPGDQLVLHGVSYRVAAVVPLERDDPSGASTLLVVEPAS